MVAFLVTMWTLGDKFGATAAAATLGSLFTLVGTVAGAYFGVKNSSDTADRAARETKAANDRTERANKSAKAALLEVDSSKSQDFRDRGLV